MSEEIKVHAFVVIVPENDPSFESPNGKDKPFLRANDMFGPNKGEVKSINGSFGTAVVSNRVADITVPLKMLKASR